MKLNIACGSNILPAPWRNLDINRPNPEDRIDATKPLPFGDASVEVVLAEHFCEHLIAGECLAFFDECHRILQPGGVLRVCVPILDRLKTKEHARDILTGHGHKVMMTMEVLINLLQLAGFESVTETPRKECDGHHRVIGIVKDDLETLRVEAVKAK